MEEEKFVVEVEDVKFEKQNKYADEEREALDSEVIRQHIRAQHPDADEEVVDRIFDIYSKSRAITSIIPEEKIRERVSKGAEEEYRRTISVLEEYVNEAAESLTKISRDNSSDFVSRFLKTFNKYTGLGGSLLERRRLKVAQEQLQKETERLEKICERAEEGIEKYKARIRELRQERSNYVLTANKSLSQINMLVDAKNSIENAIYESERLLRDAQASNDAFAIAKYQEAISEYKLENQSINDKIEELTEQIRYSKNQLDNTSPKLQEAEVGYKLMKKNASLARKVLQNLESMYEEPQGIKDLSVLIEDMKVIQSTIEPMRQILQTRDKATSEMYKKVQDYVDYNPFPRKALEFNESEKDKIKKIVSEAEELTSLINERYNE